MNAGIVGNTDSPASKFNGPYNAIDRANELMFNQMYFIAEKAFPCEPGIGVVSRIVGKLSMADSFTGFGAATSKASWQR